MIVKMRERVDQIVRASFERHDHGVMPPSAHLAADRRI
jgi:hypothetical protein